MIIVLPSPRLRGEGGEHEHSECEPGEGHSEESLNEMPLTRLASLGTLSRGAGEGLLR